MQCGIMSAVLCSGERLAILRKIKKKRDQHLVQAALKQGDVEACHPFLVCNNTLLFWCFGLAFADEKRVATPGCFTEVKAVLLLVLPGKYNYT